LPPEEGRSPEKQAGSSSAAGHLAGAILDPAGPGKTELEVALRQAIAAAIIAGDDETADRLRAVLLPKPGAALRLVKRG
jgi:hypothetical protein